MKVGTRMTVATAVIVTMALGIYAVLDLRSAYSERRDALQRNVESVALALRYQLEARGTQSSISRAAERSAQMSEAVAPLRVSIVPAEGAEPTSDLGKRLKALVEGRSVFLFSERDDSFIYSLPLRHKSPQDMDGFEVLGAIEVYVETSYLDAATRSDIWRTTLSVLGIILISSLAVFWFSRMFVTDPISKLLGGVDDVAQGDLSRVLLAEREDEIGDLAARFNEMTFSLRESQAETRRHNETRTNLEQKLFQTEKLATIGQIAAEIAHEVGTPLNVISGRAKGMARRADQAETVEKNAAIIAEQAARITRIIQRLLDFSRRKVGAEEAERVSLNLLTLNTMEFLQSKLAAANIKHTLSRDEGLPDVKGNPDQLLQVLTNLILNATEAMSNGGGTLAVETAHVTRRRPGLEVAPELPVVVVSVTDSGPGIPEEEREKIFEPFYSSKTGEGGTGLGLAVVHGIVKAHDGWIELSDAPKGGCCFSVYFPAVDET